MITVETVMSKRPKGCSAANFITTEWESCATAIYPNIGSMTASYSMAAGCKMINFAGATATDTERCAIHIGWRKSYHHHSC